MSEYTLVVSPKGYNLFYKGDQRIAKDKVPPKIVEKLLAAEQKKPAPIPKAVGIPAKKKAPTPPKRPPIPQRPVPPKKKTPSPQKAIKRSKLEPAPPRAQLPAKNIVPGPPKPPLIPPRAQLPAKNIVPGPPKPPLIPPRAQLPAKNIVLGPPKPPLIPSQAQLPAKNIVPGPPKPALIPSQAQLPAKNIVPGPPKAAFLPKKPQSPPKRRPRAASLTTCNQTLPRNVPARQRVLQTKIKDSIYAVVVQFPDKHPEVAVNNSLSGSISQIQDLGQQLGMYQDEKEDLVSNLKRKGSYYWSYAKIRFYLFYVPPYHPLSLVYHQHLRTAPTHATSAPASSGRPLEVELFVPLVIIPGYKPELRIYDLELPALYGLQSIGGRLGLDDEEMNAMTTMLSKEGAFYRPFGNMWFYLYHVKKGQNIATLYDGKK